MMKIIVLKYKHYNIKIEEMFLRKNVANTVDMSSLRAQ